jgi:hypothetical protein
MVICSKALRRQKFAEGYMAITGIEFILRIFQDRWTGIRILNFMRNATPTSQAFEGEPILYVYHDMDGEWQFLTELAANMANLMVVALSEITKPDPTINEIYHLPYGWRAWRVDSHSDWQTEEYEMEEGKEE